MRNAAYLLKSAIGVLIGGLVLASCSSTSPDYVLSADHTQLVRVNHDKSHDIVPLDRATIVKHGHQTTILYLADAIEHPELHVYSSESGDRFQRVGTYAFDDLATEPNAIVDATDVGNGVILAELHVNPSDSWSVLCDTKSKQLRPYLASSFACNEGGTQVAYIGWQPHWGGGPASIYVNGRVVGTIVEQDYWGIRWSKSLNDFVLFNNKGEGVCLSLPGQDHRELNDDILKSVIDEHEGRSEATNNRKIP